MQQVDFAEGYFDAVSVGTKATTVRWNENIAPGAARFVFGARSLRGRVESVTSHAAATLTAEQADAADAKIIDTVKARSFGIAVVGIGSSVEASVLASANLVDAGVASIWAKALSPEHARILERIGVHNVVRPEADSGRRVAHLVNGRLQDYIEFDGGYAIIKMRPPQETLGFTLEQSQLRRKYGVTVVGVKSPGQDFTYAVPSTKVMQGDTLIVAGKTELLEQLASRP